MEQLDILSIVFFALAAIVLAMAAVFFVIFYRPIGGDDVHFDDNVPARYEDYEAVFYDPLN